MTGSEPELHASADRLACMPLAGS